MTRLLITGAAGMVGRALLQDLPTGAEVIATDLHKPTDLPGSVTYLPMDVTTAQPEQIIAQVKPDVIIHLASIVTPPSGMGRAAAFAVDVEGTRKVLEAAIANGTRRLVVTSSGAAYGYHPDNPVPLREGDALRGNPEFPYSDHKRQVEELLAAARQTAPGLEQVILRVGTVLGDGTENQITALFHKPRLLAVTGSESPFVFIWTRDLARILKRRQPMVRPVSTMSPETAPWASAILRACWVNRFSGCQPGCSGRVWLSHAPLGCRGTARSRSGFCNTGRFWTTAH